MSCKQCLPNKKIALDKKDNFLLIGSPNVGKSTFFTRVTWSSASIGNVDGITVNVQNGKLKNNKNVSLIDLPGIRDLATTTIEEEIVIKTILNNDYNGALNIVAAPTLKRDLILTMQLLEAGILNEIVVNMVDELDSQKLDTFHLSKFLGVPVNSIIASKNIGVNQTITCLLTQNAYKKPFHIDYGDKIEKIISKIETLLPTTKVSKRFLAIQYLSKNSYIHKLFDEWDISNKIQKILCEFSICLNQTKNNIYFAKKNRIETIVDHCFSDKKININQENAISLSNKIRQNLINNNLKIIKKSHHLKGTEKRRKLAKSKKIDGFLLQKWVAIPLFLIIVAVVYYICFGSYAGGWIVDQFTGAMDLGVSKIGDAMTNSGASEWAVNFVKDGLFGGIVTVLGFLPYILFLHVCMAILEQSGLLARISVILDKSFERYGLSGRSVITLMTGLGCNIPSVLMARNSHSKKERFITILIAPLIACSARIVVFNWIANAIINPNFAWLLVLCLTILSGFVALGIGWTFSTTLFRNKRTFLLTELPPWRRPDFIAIIKSSLNEIWQFVKRVFTIIFIVNIVMFLLTYIGPIAGAFIPTPTDVDVLNPNNTSFLGYISYGLKYLAYPIGLGGDWRLFASVIASAPAKELAASNLELLFGNQQNFSEAIFNSTLTKLPIATTASYLVFFSFFTPCLSTDIVIKKEAGTKIMLLELLMSFVVAYGMSAIVFNGIGFVELLTQKSMLITNGLLISIIIVLSCFLLFNIVMPIIGDWLKRQRTEKALNKLFISNKVWIGIDGGLVLTFIILMTTTYGIYA